MKYSEFFKMLEKKDHLVNKLANLTSEQKEEAIRFFTKHPNYESEIDWNRKDLTWEDFEEVMFKERISVTQLKNFVKKDKHFLVLHSDKNCVIYQPLTWLGSRYLASTDVKPKVEGKWCISYQKDRSYWDSYSFGTDDFEDEEDFDYDPDYREPNAFLFLFTPTTKYALQIPINNSSYFTIWDSADNDIAKEDFIKRITKEEPSALDIIDYYDYVGKAVEAHDLVVENHKKDLEECAYIEKVKKEEKQHRIKIFPKSFKNQVKKKGYYSWDGDITYDDLKNLGLIDEKGRVDERFKYFKISGSLNFSNSFITSITIPNGVEVIKLGAFHKCSSLTSVIIPDSVTSIKDSAFDGCSSLKEITIPDSVTEIGMFAFDKCSSLESINIPDSVTSIGTAAFRSCSSLSEITIPDGVTSIGVSTFNNCTSLKSIAIPNSVIEIGTGAFMNCTSLTSITIPSSITKIGDSAFFGCKSLTSVTIPDSVTEIGSQAFASCTSLTEVTIPDSVTYIGTWAFFACPSLKSFYIDKEKDSMSINKIKLPGFTQVYWKGEF